ncbi:unnamed protein product [Linum trigynum]|uniref:Uncharacterized protein n=1 Tax=Linum trigynum TaxID=586398 RepID=A0AAV2FS25_9ROSI
MEHHQDHTAEEPCGSCRELNRWLERLEERVSDWVSIFHQRMNDFDRFVHASIAQVDSLRVENKVFVDTIKVMPALFVLLEKIIREGQRRPNGKQGKSPESELTINPKPINVNPNVKFDQEKKEDVA